MFRKSSISSGNMSARTNTQGFVFLVILTLISVTGLVGSDLYLPALPIIKSEFQKSSHAMQLTLSLYLLGLSAGQLFWGPISDHYGRKKPLLLGLSIYTLASFFCAFNTSYLPFLLLRLLQALGASSGLVIGRAIVGDLYNRNEAGKIFSTIFPFVGMSPAISPLIGGLITYYTNWQMVFIAIVVFGLLTVFLVSYVLKESLPIENKKNINMLHALSTYKSLLKNNHFIHAAMPPTIAYIAYFAYITQSPFIFSAHGFSEKQIGFFYITLSLSYVGGSLLARKLLNYFTLNKLIRFGYINFTLGAFLFLTLNVTHFSLLFTILSISILTFGNGFLIPLGTANLINTFPKKTGAASGLLGCLQLGLAAFSSSIVASITGNSAGKLGSYIFVIAIVGLSLNLCFHQSNSRHTKLNKL